MGKEHIATNLKRIRKSKGISQVALASQIGKSNQSIQMYEYGKRIPNNEVIKQLASVLSVSPTEIYEDYIEEAPEDGTNLQGYKVMDPLSKELYNEEMQKQIEIYREIIASYEAREGTYTATIDKLMNIIQKKEDFIDELFSKFVKKEKIVDTLLGELHE